MFQIVIKMACDWNRMKKAFKSLQKCISRIAKKQEQFQKLNLKMLSEWQMSGIESRKVFKTLQKYINRIARSKDSFKNFVSNFY